MSGLPDDVDERVDALYCLPLDRFVPERDALAKALRAEGSRAEATVVAKLPKPSVAAWAVNQVVRSQAGAARELWAAGDAVLTVQQRAVSGGAGGAELREAIAAQRAALAPLADAARGMLTGRGAFLGEQAVQAVIETLHAAAVDPEARPDVERGRLARPLRLAGLGALPAAATGAAERPSPPGGGGAERPAAWGGGAKEDAAAARAEREREAEERRRAKERDRELAAARRRVEQARRARDAAADRVERRREELAAGETELERLEEDLREAEEAAEE